MKEPTISVVGVLDALREGLQVVSPELRYLYVNEAVCRQGRRSREELLGRRMEDLYPGIEDTEVVRRIRSCLRDGAPVAFQNEFAYPDGSRAWFELRIEAVPEGVAILSIDVTQRKELELQLAAVQRLEAVGRLAGGVAHDLNNILTILRGYAEIVAPEIPGVAQADFQGMIAAAARAEGLVSHLLAFARKRPIAPRVVDPNAIVNPLAEVLRRVLREDVGLVCDLDPSVAPVRIDPTALEQVVVNLVVNARDAITGPGTIRVETRTCLLSAPLRMALSDTAPAGRWTVLRVVDDGAGISPESMACLFEPFFTTKGGSGTGLGLSTCYGIVRQAGGYVNVVSAPGRGSTFEVWLPRAEPEAAVVEATPAPRVASPGRMLFVEDDPMLRDVLVRGLVQHGWDVVPVASAEQALATGGTFDLLVTDVSLPGLGGPDLARELARRGGPRRVLFVSGHAETEIVVPEGLRSDFLRKPYRPSELAERARRLLG